MTKAPPIPKEQRTFKAKADIEGGKMDRRDQTTNLQSNQPGDADVNLKQQGRHGDINQNTHHQGYQQDR